MLMLFLRRLANNEVLFSSNAMRVRGNAKSVHLVLFLPSLAACRLCILITHAWKLSSGPDKLLLIIWGPISHIPHGIPLPTSPTTFIPRVCLQVGLVLVFLQQLRHAMRELVSSWSQVIWYDSVTHEGELAWQDELNSRNR